MVKQIKTSGTSKSQLSKNADKSKNRKRDESSDEESDIELGSDSEWSTDEDDDDDEEYDPEEEDESIDSHEYRRFLKKMFPSKHLEKTVKLIHTTNTKNTDLLYALKGSGHGSYGAIIEFKFNIYNDIYCQIATLTWVWNSEEIFRLINFYQQWIINKPINITTDLNISYNNGSAFFL
jgi:hypothetical protein